MPLNGRDRASLVFLAGAAVVGANVDLVANGKNYRVQIISVRAEPPMEPLIFSMEARRS